MAGVSTFIRLIAARRCAQGGICYGNYVCLSVCLFVTSVSCGPSACNACLRTFVPYQTLQTSENSSKRIFSSAFNVCCPLLF